MQRTRSAPSSAMLRAASGCECRATSRAPVTLRAHCADGAGFRTRLSGGMSGAEDRLRAYARLAVRVGVNVQPGQVLGINALVEHRPLVQAAAEEAYASGASYVDVLYTDQHVRRAHIQHAP